MPPLNLVGDFGGGGMMLAFGILAAVLEAGRSGQGQVVDASMVDGSASLLTMVFAFQQLGWWKPERGVNILDTGAHFYEVYETADGGFFAVGAIEAKFYAELLKGLQLDPADLPDQNDRTQWPAMKERFAAIFKHEVPATSGPPSSRGRTPAASPVLSPNEAHLHPHNQARGTYVEVDGLVQPGPVPRFSRTPAGVSRPPSHRGPIPTRPCAEWGVDEATLQVLHKARGATVERLEVDHRAGDRAGDPLDPLDLAHHHTTQLVHRGRRRPGDHVVGAGDVLGQDDAVDGVYLGRHLRRLPDLGLDEDVGVYRHRGPPGSH